MKSLSNSSHSSNESLSVKTGNIRRIVELDEIVYLKGDDCYTCLNLLDRQRLLVSKSLGKFETMLCKHRFFRCHKSFIINRSFIKEIRYYDKPQIYLKTGDLVPVARRRLSDLL